MWSHHPREWEKRANREHAVCLPDSIKESPSRNQHQPKQGWSFSVRDVVTQVSVLLWSLASFDELVIKVIIHPFMVVLFVCLFVLRQGSHVVQSGPKLTEYLRVALNSWSSGLHFPSAEILTSLYILQSILRWSVIWWSCASYRLIILFAFKIPFKLKYKNTFYC